MSNVKVHISENTLNIWVEDKKVKEILALLREGEKIEITNLSEGVNIGDLKMFTISFKNFAGVLRNVKLDKDGESQDVLVVPEKLCRAWNLMNSPNPLEEFEGKFKNFVAKILENFWQILNTLGITGEQITLGDKFKDLENIEIDILKFLIILFFIEEIKEYIELIHRNPHRVLISTEEYVPIGYVSEVDENVLVDILTNPQYLYKNSSASWGIDYNNDKYCPLYVKQYLKEETFDNLENRFVKHFLQEIYRIIHEVSKDLGIHNKDFIVRYKGEIDSLLSSGIFAEVGDLTYMPTNSQVLLKRYGYREIFYIYNLLGLGFSVYSNYQEVFLSLRDMATLWEYYVLSYLLKKFSEKFESKDMRVEIKKVLLDYAILEVISSGYKFGYQKSFDSYSNLEMRPDISILEDNNIRYIFDAKFRDFENNRSDILLNMHYYRDALNVDFSIALCFSNEKDNEGEFYQKSDGSKKIKLDEVIEWIKNQSVPKGVGYVNIKIPV